MLTAQEAIEILVKTEKCSTDDCPVTEGCDICPYNVSEEKYEEAIKMAITALKNFPTQMSGTSDLVSRQYLLDEYDRQHVGPPDGARKIIEEAPAVGQKTGHWIPVDDPSITGRCSVCGFESHLCEDDVYGYDYCPNCGARLEVVDE